MIMIIVVIIVIVVVVIVIVVVVVQISITVTGIELNFVSVIQLNSFTLFVMCRSKCSVVGL